MNGSSISSCEKEVVYVQVRKTIGVLNVTYDPNNVQGCQSSNLNVTNFLTIDAMYDLFFNTIEEYGTNNIKIEYDVIYGYPSFWNLNTNNVNEVSYQINCLTDQDHNNATINGSVVYTNETICYWIKPGSSDDDKHVGAIVGGVLGGLALVIIIGLLIKFCCCKKTPKQKIHMGNNYQSMEPTPV